MGWPPTGVDPPAHLTLVGGQPSGRTWPQGHRLPGRFISRNRSSFVLTACAVFGHGVASYRRRPSGASHSGRRPALWTNMAARPSSPRTFFLAEPCPSLVLTACAVFGHGVASYRRRPSGASHSCRRPALWPNMAARPSTPRTFYLSEPVQLRSDGLRRFRPRGGLLPA